MPRAEVRSQIGPFAVVPLWLIESGVSAQAIRAYALLGAKWADRETGECYPSHSTIAKELGVASSTSRLALDELKAVGAITAQERFRDGEQLPTLLTVWQTPADRSADPCRQVGNKPELINQRGRDEGSEEVEVVKNKKPNTSRAREKSDTEAFTEEFETVFWPAYPTGRKVAKATARRAYIAARRSGATAQEIINGLGAAVAHWTRTGKIKNGKAGQYVPHPATWLNGERWLDDLSIAADDVNPLTANTDSIREKAARWAS